MTDFNFHQVLSWYFTEEQRRGAMETEGKRYAGPDRLYDEIFIEGAQFNDGDRRVCIRHVFGARFKPEVFKRLKGITKHVSHDKKYLSNIVLTGSPEELLDKAKKVDELLNNYRTS